MSSTDSQSKADNSNSSSLPSGWSQHTGPQGQVYYYNSISKQSTYSKPTSTSTSSSTNGSTTATAKDKPISKIPIPDTDGWLKVTTTQGNVFYSHKPSKRSEWSIPEEIKDQVERFNRQLKAEESENDDSGAKRKREEIQNDSATEKPSQSSQDADPASKRPRTEENSTSEQQSITEFMSDPSGRDHQEETEENEGEGDEDQDENEDEEWQRQMAAEMAAEAQELEEKEREEEEIDPETAKEERIPDRNPPGPPPSKPSDQPFPTQSQPLYSGPPPPLISNPNFSIPPPTSNPNYSVPPPPISIPYHQQQQQPPATNFSHEESLALFKHMLTTLNGTREEIDPMAPWDKELPKFVHRIEYSRLNSLKDRQEAFNDWCKVRLREKRAEKAKAKEKEKDEGGSLKVSSSNNGKGKEKEREGRSSRNGKESENGNGNDKGEEEKSYRELLKENVTSTRMIWDDFRKKFKKDRRFFGFGRDDKVREKVFRDWLRELGEVKRLASIQAEKDFKVLLSEKLSHQVQEESKQSKSKEEVSDLWKQLKQTPGLVEDERYEKVGSSSKRLELFGDWLKNPDNSNNNKLEPSKDTSSTSNSKSKSEQREKALKERSEQVRKEKNQLDRTNQSALNQIQKQDASLNFNQFLIDEIKDPLLTFDEISKTFDKDKRFNDRNLHWNAKKELVENHLNNLFGKKRSSLRKIFEEVSKGSLDLDEREEEVLSEVKENEEFERLKLDSLFRDEKLEKEFKIWKNEKFEKARLEFQEMLKENAFISFWGKLRKEKEGGKEGEEKVDDDEDEEDQPDLLKMAQKVDLEEVHSVLRNDQRYRTFKHLPEKRDEWIRDHLSNQAKLNQTVHQK